ncbi:MAG: hypothetical protein KDH19_10500 [Geminicoccaceae bacterium]|nr:hypothetical protein [Geminicoccaceae bacterium]
MAETSNTGGVCPNTTPSRIEQIVRLESTTVDIETGLNIIEKLTKSDDCEALGDQTSYIVSRLYQHLDEMHNGFAALRTSKEDAA